MTLTVIVLDGAAGALSVAVPLLAFTRYDQNAHIAGWLFTGFGVGAVIGSVLVDQAARPVRAAAARSGGDPARDAAALGDRRAGPRGRSRVAAVVICGVFVPMVNAPDHGTPLDPSAARGPGQGDDGGDDRERARRPVRAARGRPGLHAVGKRRASGSLIAGGLTVGALLFIAAVLRGEAEAAPATVTAA